MNRKSMRLLSTAIVALAGPMLLPHSAAAGDDGKFVSAARHYDTYCVQCHGVNRNGRGINSRDMSVQPRDHRSAEHTSELQSLMRISYAVFCFKQQIHPSPIHQHPTEH